MQNRTRTKEDEEHKLDQDAKKETNSAVIQDLHCSDTMSNTTIDIFIKNQRCENECNKERNTEKKVLVTDELVSLVII